MNILTTLRKLTGRPINDLDAANAAKADIERELLSAQAEFSAAEASFGADLVAAMADGGMAKAEALESQLSAKRRAVERLRAAREAVASRIERAQEATDAATLAQRWDRVAVLLEARTAALAVVERKAKELGAALLEAEAAALAAYENMPIRATAAGAARKADITAQFTSLGGHVPTLLALATDGRSGGATGSVLWDLRQRPTLSERSKREAAEWLRHRPETPPEAA